MGSEPGVTGHDPCLARAGDASYEGLRVLVVEDQYDSAASLATMLHLYGFDVRVAADGPTALQKAYEVQPQVVLLDIGLPGMDGWQVAEQLRRTAEPGPLIIALTGYGDEASRVHSYAAGIDMHLTKPVDPRLLKRVLTEFHERAQQRSGVQS